MTISNLSLSRVIGARLAVVQALGFLCLRGVAGDPFAENVRSTPWLSPEQEQRSFHLPPGFQINLFAAEPDIAKPMNMAFDERGRLWVTVTVEYPYPAPPDRLGRDSIRILEDTDGDGRADRVSTFVDGLNIPIGLYPYKNGVIAWSIPNIWHFQDTDGDGRADRREVLYGPLGWERDTHGMNSSFTRGFDGWLYATHGFNNDTTVRGKDGHEVSMNSGNTYRLRLDGARIEQYTWGQVNPFGLCFDPRGNLYSADCHSEPVYALLRGGYYPSFGKPHDGLGFAPSMIFHDHGSTAICGVLFYADDQWPAAYDDNVFTGNVMTSRIDWDALTFHGSTPVAQDQGPFVRTDDPWFRPVNIQLGPEGAMYVADFYNRIIGHYEVPLDHPGRDRNSGRIWRITYQGPEVRRSPATGSVQRRYDISRASLEDLIAELRHPNLTRRMLAANQITDRVGSRAVSPLKRLLRAASIPACQRIHALWLLYRLGALDENLVAAPTRAAEAPVRVHAMRILTEIQPWSPGLRALALAGLKDQDPLVRRCAAEALGTHPEFENIVPLLALREQTPAADTHLVYVARKAIRDQLQAPGMLARLQLDTLREADARAIADVAPAIATADAALFLLSYLHRYEEPPESLAAALRHAARYLPEARVDELARFTRAKFEAALDIQLELFHSIQRGASQRGLALSDASRAWGAELAEKLLDSVPQGPSPWTPAPVEGANPGGNPWTVQMRPVAGRNHPVPFLTTLPAGEQAIGLLRSRPFTIPARLSFFVAGHDGSPDKPPQKKNAVRLRAAGDEAVLAQTWAPRQDQAQPVTWELAAQAGREGFLELVDADNADGYAWLAVGQFDPPVATVPTANPGAISKREQAAAELARALELRRLQPRLARLVARADTDPEARAALAGALAALRADETLGALTPLLGEPGLPGALRDAIVQAAVQNEPGPSHNLLTEAFRTASTRLQVKLAQSLAGNPGGLERLLDLVAGGHAPPRLLLERPVKEKVRARNAPQLVQRVEQLTRGVEPLDHARQESMGQLRRGYNPAAASAEEGAAVFAKNCAVCHQIDGQGALIGPQLDGIGARGLERLVEDVLDPNRNVDRAFRNTLAILEDGDVASGLFRREEGEVLIFAESTGKEFSLPKKRIKERRESETSLMPDNFVEVLAAGDFNHLMAFLLSKTATAADKK
jgi:putative heme-binding domain-containing protein